MGYLTELLVGAAGSLIAAEVWVHADPASRWLIKRAVRRLPEDQQERRLEEWLAGLDEFPGAIRKLLHAFGCWTGAPAVGQAASLARAVQARAVPAVRSRAREIWSDKRIVRSLEYVLFALALALAGYQMASTSSDQRAIELKIRELQIDLLKREIAAQDYIDKLKNSR
jgi:hypothetical protein